MTAAARVIARENPVQTVGNPTQKARFPLEINRPHHLQMVRPPRSRNCRGHDRNRRRIPMPNHTPGGSIGRRLRYEILRRDKFTCRYCGAKAPDVTLTVDHVVPVALGGTDHPSNLVAACDECNGGKSSTAPDQQTVEDVDQIAFLYAAAIKRATEARALEWARIADSIEAFKVHWDRWTISGTDRPIPLDDDWASSVERWLMLDITTADLTRFVPIAMNSKASISDKWRYYCGCIWKEIDTRRKLALELMNRGEVVVIPDQSDEPMPYPFAPLPDPAGYQFDDLELDDMALDDMALDGLDVDAKTVDEPQSEPFESWLDRVFIRCSLQRACGICKLTDPRTHCGRDDCFLPSGGASGP